MKHFLSTQDLSNQEFSEVLALAQKLKRERYAHQELKHLSMTALFWNPSLRTRVSFIRAMEELGGSCTTLDVNEATWKLATQEGVVMDKAEAEHIKEAIPVLGRYSHVLGARCFGEGKSYETDRQDALIRAIAKVSSVPVINMESAMEHPCQGLADALTVLEKKTCDKPKVVLSWSYHPKALPMAVPNSFLLSLSRMGCDLTLARPEGFELDEEIIRHVHANTSSSGGTFTQTEDQAQALKGAHFVYAKSWGSRKFYGQPEAEFTHRQGLQPWMITASKMAQTSDGKFMHCLPVRRNVVVSDDVLDSYHSVVVDQAENRLHVQKAILLKLLEKA